MKEYSYDDCLLIGANMIKYGGSFVHALGHALLKADAINRNKLVRAFPKYFDEYFNWGKQ